MTKLFSKGVSPPVDVFSEILKDNCLIVGSYIGSMPQMKTMLADEAIENDYEIHAIDILKVEYDIYDDRFASIATTHKEAFDLVSKLAEEEEYDKKTVLFVEELIDIIIPTEFSRMEEGVLHNIKDKIGVLIDNPNITVVVFSVAPRIIFENKWILDTIDNKVILFTPKSYHRELVLGQSATSIPYIGINDRIGYFIQKSPKSITKFSVQK